MSIMRFRPRRDLVSIRDEVNHLFDNFFTGWPEPRQGLLEGEWAPSIDVAETNGDITVTAELPGVKQEEVDIAIADDVLTLKGEKKEERKEEKEDYHLSERRYGMIERAIRLPATADQDAVEAAFDKGVLTVTVPKHAAPEKTARKVEIKGR